MIERFQNIGGFRVANVYLAYLGQSSTFKVGLLAIFLEIETANQNINDLNSRLPELNADIKFSDSSTAIPTMPGKVVLIPQGYCLQVTHIRTYKGNKWYRCIVCDG